MSTKELQRVSGSQWERLKALGFDWITETPHWAVGVGFLLPEVALALKWMRDVKGRQNGVVIRADSSNYYDYYCEYYDENNKVCYPKGFQKTYEESESILLDALLTYLEKGDNYE